MATARIQTPDELGNLSHMLWLVAQSVATAHVAQLSSVQPDNRIYFLH